MPVYCERIVNACFVRFNFKDFWVDHETGNAGDVDFPRAVEIVGIVAGIIEAGRGDNRVVGDFTAAYNTRSIWVLDEFALFRVFCWNSGGKRE